MCPIMNVCHLSPAPHSVSRDICTFLLCWNESRELLPKLHCLSYIIFLSVFGLLGFFLEAWKQLFVSGQHVVEESPCLLRAEQRSLHLKSAEEKWREGTQRGRAARPQRRQGPALPPHLPWAIPGVILVINGTRHPREKGWKNLRSGHSEPCLPFQLNGEAFHISTQLRLAMASLCFSLSRGQRITHFLGQLFIRLSANSWGQWWWWTAGGWRVWKLVIVEFASYRPQNNSAYLLELDI